MFLANSIGQKAFPAFFQFVTHTIFKWLMKAQYPLADGSATESPGRPLTYQEQNALRYVAGYVIRKLCSQYEASHHPKKNDVIFFLFELAGDEVVEDGDTEAWTNIVDRGGLWHINDLTYTLFVTIEEVVRRFLTLGTNNQQEGMRKAMTEAVLKSNDVLFQWCLIAASSDDNTAALVLHEIVDLYVKVRGFAFASSCLELYKQEHQKTLQKRRALRSEVCPRLLRLLLYMFLHNTIYYINFIERHNDTMNVHLHSAI